jgi:hypothetical protein
MSDADDEREDLRFQVEVSVRSGIGSEETVLDAIGLLVDDILGEPDEDLKSELEAYARELLEEMRRNESRWTERTTNDAIDAAFDDLNAAGIVALQDAGYTQSDGWADVNERAARLRPQPRGATFYHRQDLERGLAGEGLWLTFGAYDDGEEHDAASVAVGREIFDVLVRHGVGARWNGTTTQRIQISPFEWRKRRFTRAPGGGDGPARAR